MEIGEESGGSKESIKPTLTYHHTRPLEQVIFGVVNQARRESHPEDPWIEQAHKAYSWLEEQVGFYPIF